MVLSMNNHNAYLIIDAGGTSLKSAVLTKNGKVLKNSFFSTPAFSEGSRLQITEAYSKTALHGLSVIERNEMALGGIGIATPGPFDYENGIPLMTHKFQEIHGVSLRKILQQITGVSNQVPIRFMHDANAVLAGEIWKGNARGYRNTAVVTLGTGVGFAFSQDNVVQRNEMGGPLISVYKQPFAESILEDYVSKRGILRIYQQKKGIGKTDELEVADLAQQADSGDVISRSAFLEAGKILALALEPVLKERSIQCLLFGGQISRSFHLMEDSIKSGLANVTSLLQITAVKSIESSAFLGTLYNLKFNP